MDTTTNADSRTASPTGLRGRVYAVLEAPDSFGKVAPAMVRICAVPSYRRYFW